MRVLMKTIENIQYIKPVGLINIDRSELTAVNNKILNFFVYLSTSEYEINKQLFIPNTVQNTTLSRIAKGIEDRSRQSARLKKSVLDLAKATAHYGVFNFEGDTSVVKRTSEGLMSPAA